MFRGGKNLRPQEVHFIATGHTPVTHDHSVRITPDELLRINTPRLPPSQKSMISLILLPFLIVILSQLASADNVANLNNTSDYNPSRYVRAPIYRKGAASNSGVGYYWINLGFGNYTASVIVDSGTSNDKLLITGSGDLWVADEPGQYVANNSATFQYINSSFAITYDSKVGAYGYGVYSRAEGLEIGGPSISDYQVVWSQRIRYLVMRRHGVGSGFMGVR
jgi:hypothetical protein